MILGLPPRPKRPRARIVAGLVGGDRPAGLVPTRGLVGLLDLEWVLVVSKNSRPTSRLYGSATASYTFFARVSSTCSSQSIAR